jgi:hypothetical protein
MLFVIRMSSNLNCIWFDQFNLPIPQFKLAHSTLNLITNFRWPSKAVVLMEGVSLLVMGVGLEPQKPRIKVAWLARIKNLHSPSASAQPLNNPSSLPSLSASKDFNQRTVTVSYYKRQRKTAKDTIFHSTFYYSSWRTRRIANITSIGRRSARQVH